MLCYTHLWTQGTSSFAVLWAHSPSKRGPPCTFIPQATWAFAHSHGTPLALPTLLLSTQGYKRSPQGYKRSPQGAGMQGFLDLLAAIGVLLQDLAEVFLFFPLQDA